MITPPYLKKGDLIGIVSPAKSIPAERIENAGKVITSFGFEVKTGKHATSSYHQFAGTDAERTADFQEMLDDDRVKMILCSRGGYGSVRIIDKLDFGRFVKHPKWIAGYSDITVFHAHVFTNFGIETLHATMPLNFGKQGKHDLSTELLFAAASGKKTSCGIAVHPLNRKGSGSGLLAGGNISVLCSLAGSTSDLNTDRKVLFLEDVGENLYRLDRMMWTLKRAGKLSNLAGLIVGGLTAMEDNETAFGKTPEEILSEAVADYGYPVCFGFPAGHQPENHPLILGRNVVLEVSGNKVSLAFDHR